MAEIKLIFGSFSKNDNAFEENTGTFLSNFSPALCMPTTYLNLRSRLFRAMEFYGKCHKSHKLHTSVEIKNATSVSI